MNIINESSIIQRLNSGSIRSVALKRNIIGSLIAKVLSILISLVLVPMTLGYLTSELYGIWLTLSSIIHWLTFFDIGFTQGLKNKLAESLAVKDFIKSKALVSTTYIIMLAIFIPLGIILCLCVPLFDWTEILNVDSSFRLDINNTLYILIWAFCSQMIVNVISSVIMAYQKVALSSFFMVIANFLSLIVVYLLTQFSKSSLFLLAYSISFIPIIVLIIAGFFLYQGSFKRVCPSINSWDNRYVKELFGLGYRFFLIQIQYIVLFQATNFIISNISGPEHVTTYNIAYKYLSLTMMVYSIILTPLWPAFTDAYTNNDYAWMNGVYLKMTKVFLGISSGMILLVLLSPFVYKIWLGDKVSIPVEMTVMVAIYMIINMWDSLQVNVINGTGKLKIEIYVTTIGMILHIPLSYFLGQYFGCYGVLISMIFIISIYSTVMTIQTRKLLKGTAFGVWAA